MILNRLELPYNVINTVITLEEESIQICKVWKSIIKYSFVEEEMMNHVSITMTNLFQSLINIICRENNIPIFRISTLDVNKLPLECILIPITYELVIDLFFSKYK